MICSGCGGIFGGIMLILGNYQIFQGEIYKSIKMFLLADIAWLWMAFTAGNIIGIITVSIGVILSVFAFMKIHKGEYNKSIRKENE